MKAYTTRIGSQRRIGPTKILYLTGDVNYCQLHLITGEVILMSRTLKWYEAQWPTLLRIHKQALINPDYAQELNLASRMRDTSLVVMTNFAALPIARRRLRRVQQELSVRQFPSISLEN